MNNTSSLLFNITADEARIAWINKKRKLLNIQIEPTQKATSTRGNIYVAEVIKVERSLNANFATYLNTPVSKQGFLPWKETHTGINNDSIVSREISAKDNAEISGNKKLTIGQKIIVQISRDERDGKGAALTTFISLAGAFLVLMPNNFEASGISRKAEGNNRDKAKKIIEDLKFPDSMGVIIRTAGLSCTKEELQADLNSLLLQWEETKNKAQLCNQPTLIKQEIFGIDKLIRDSLCSSIQQILIDDLSTFEYIKTTIARVRPDFKGSIELYDKPAPLFTHFQIQNQIETIFQRKVDLRSGGSIIIDRTEALTSIDVNSGKSTKASNIEETALQTNLEAAEEIASQLKLRDIGGIIVIDFIDMFTADARSQIEEKFKYFLKSDNAKTQTYEISKLGLLEMSRQRVKPSIGDANLEPCTTCQKRGYTRSAQSFSSSIMHLLEEHAYHAKNHILQLQIPTDVANYIWNDKASSIKQIEKKHNIEIIIIANSDYIIPKHQIKKIINTNNNLLAAETESQQQDLSTKHVAKYQPTSQKTKENIGLFTKIWQSVFKDSQAAPSATTASKKTKTRTNHNNNHHHRKHPRSNAAGGHKHHKSKHHHNQHKRRNHAPSQVDQKKQNIGNTPNSDASKNQEYL